MNDEGGPRRAASAELTTTGEDAHDTRSCADSHGGDPRCSTLTALTIVRLARRVRALRRDVARLRARVERIEAALDAHLAEHEGIET